MLRAASPADVTFASIIIQLLNGLAAASSLFLVSAGLSLIFGVTRIVNFAHGSLYMLGLYGAYTLIEALGRTPIGFWSAVVLAALAVGLVGVLIEVLVLRRIYNAPELFQLLATFAIVLVIKDIALVRLGRRRIWSARARPASPWRSRSWASHPGLRPAADRHRPGRAGGDVAAAQPHALGRAGAGRHPGPRDGGRAGRRSGQALHLGVLRRAPCWPGWAARCRSRASPPTSISTSPSSPTPSWSPSWAGWAASAARSWPPS